MADLGGTFDANAKENNPSNVVPQGVYTLALVNGEEKAAKNGGSYLNCEFEIVDGKFAGRKIFEMFGLWLSSDKAVEIARGRLSSFCKACKKLTVNDTDELIGIPFQAKVVVETDDYGDKNKIKKFIEPTAKAAAAVPAARPAPSRPLTTPVDDEIPF